jgi:hypothetical protein
VNSDEGKLVRESEEKWSVHPNARSRGRLLRPKELDPDGPVTEVLTHGTK